MSAALDESQEALLRYLEEVAAEFERETCLPSTQFYFVHFLHRGERDAETQMKIDLLRQILQSRNQKVQTDSEKLADQGVVAMVQKMQDLEQQMSTVENLVAEEGVVKFENFGFSHF